jgi:hypothetical protein
MTDMGIYSHEIWISAVHGQPQDELAAEKFQRLAENWEKETEKSSFVVDKISHASYLAIIAMGHSALPHIFKKMQQRPGFWFAALEAITEQDPVQKTSYGRVSLVHADWMAWGKEHGYIS